LATIRLSDNGRRKQVATGRGEQRREKAVQFGCAASQINALPSPSFTRGPYTVRLLEKPGPGCALYAVYLGSTKIGQCISLPGESDCQWLERQMREQTGYAYSSAPLPTWLRERRKWVNPPGSNRHSIARKRA
jgi:hypothetical protein